MTSPNNPKPNGAVFVPSTTPLPRPELSDYIFEPLPWHWVHSTCKWPSLTTPSQIRLLKNFRKGVKFSDDGRPLVQILFCDLEVIDLDKPHSPYVALSYSVGDYVPPWYPGQETTASTSTRCLILCNGGKAYISRNLQQFLITIAYETPVWVDALCIDQSNVEEKSAQIAMFDRIYLEAESSSIWLGPADVWSDKAITLMEDIATRYERLPAERRVSRLHQFNDPALFAELGREPFSIEEWEAIILFFSRTWFRRVWMVQEIALCKGLAFACGRSLLDYSVMVAFVEWLHALGWEPTIEQVTRRVHNGDGNHAVSNVNHVFTLTRACDEGLQTSRFLRNTYLPFAPDDGVNQVAAVLGLLISINRHRWATDPRDKVFAMLGLVRHACKDKPELWALPVPDYSKSVRQVFAEATTYVISETRNLSILSENSPPKQLGTGTPDLPTWVPDFATGSNVLPLRVLDTYNASLSWEYEDIGADDDLALHLEGLCIGRINDVTPNILPRLDSNREIAYYLEFVMTAHDDGVNPFELDPMQLLFKLLTLGLFEADVVEQRKNVPCTLEEAKHAFQTWFSFHLSLWLMSKNYLDVTIDLPRGYLPVAIQSPYFPAAADTYELYRNVVFSVADYEKIEPEGNWIGQGLDTVYAETLHLFEQFTERLRNRCLFSTHEGVIGVGPEYMLPGDEVWILRGGKIPFVLRNTTGTKYSIVGECYAHGMMHGQAFQGDWESKVEEICLV